MFFGWVVISSMLMVGSLIWLAERRTNNEQVPRDWLPGISSGMWFALVKLTTVGYGDKAPITRTGRCITSAWMVISLIAVSFLTASLASAFTLFLSGTTEVAIDSPQKLSGRRVAVVEGTDGWSWRKTARCVSCQHPASTAPFSWCWIARPTP